MAWQAEEFCNSDDGGGYGGGGGGGCRHEIG